MTSQQQDDLHGYGRHYSEQKFREKVKVLPRGVSRAVLEKALMLYVILTDRDTPVWARSLIVIALGYFIWPMDLVPDTIPVVGYSDDIGVMGLALKQVFSLYSPAMQKRVDQLMAKALK